jgi:cytochrome b pre-mRNA-processing protein 3
MIFNSEKHNPDLYNILLTLSRNILFYSKIKLPDNFETRIYLMFMHFSIMMIVFKKKNKKFDQKIYDLLFHKIENNLRELGFGDVSVNKKMKEFNKILYDILLKIELKENNQNTFKINKKLVVSYFKELSVVKSIEYLEFETYFSNFYHFCFELTLYNMVREAINFKK